MPSLCNMISLSALCWNHCQLQVSTIQCGSHILWLRPTLDSTFNFPLDSSLDSRLDSNWSLVPHWNFDTWKWFLLFGYFNGVWAMAILGLVKCYSHNLGPRVALSTHAIYLPSLILPKSLVLPNKEYTKLISLLSKHNSLKMLILHLSPS